MDSAEVLSNLQALRQLYELLENDEEGMNSNKVHRTLDVRARKLLKELLVDATEKMFNTLLKVMEAQSVTPCSSQPEQPKAPKLHPPLSPDTVKSSLNDVLNYEKNSTSSKITPKKDEHPVKCQGEVSESKINTSSALPQYKKKQCHVCVAKSMKKQLSSKEGEIFAQRAHIPGNNSEDQDQQHDWVSSPISHVDEDAKRLQVPYSNPIGREHPTGETVSSSVGYNPIDQIKKMSDEGGDFAKVVANEIKEIESCILALQLSSGLRHALVNNDVDEHVLFKLGTSVGRVEHTGDEDTRREMSQTHMGESGLSGSTQLLNFGASQPIQKYGKFSESVSRRLDSLLINSLKSVSQNNNKVSSYFNRPRVPASRDEVAMKSPLQVKIPTPVQTSRTNLVQHRSAKKAIVSSNSSMSRQSMQSKASSVGVGHGSTKKFSQIRTREMTEKRHNQIMMRPVLLDDHKPSRRTGSHTISSVVPRKKIMPRLQVEEEEEEEETSSSSSRSSSMWTTKKSESSADSFSNVSEDCWSSTKDELSESENKSHESESNSFISSVEDEGGRSRVTHPKVVPYSRKKYPESSSYTSSEEEDGGSRFTHHEVFPYSRKKYPESSSYISSEEEKEGRSRFTHHEVVPYSQKKYSESSSYISSEEEEGRSNSRKKYPDKSVGRLRRMKNKLGHIFHHHHHHHHHHYHHGSNDPSTWKKVQKMFHRKNKNKHGKSDKGHGDGVRKSLAVKKKSNENQGRHFHALVEGLMRHVKHSKKSKGGFGRPHQVVSKLHWWKMIRRGGGVKRSKRGRVKLGFANKRPKLKMMR